MEAQDIDDIEQAIPREGIHIPTPEAEDRRGEHAADECCVGQSEADGLEERAELVGRDALGEVRLVHHLHRRPHVAPCPHGFEGRELRLPERAELIGQAGVRILRYRDGRG